MHDWDNPGSQKPKIRDYLSDNPLAAFAVKTIFIAVIVIGVLVIGTFLLSLIYAFCMSLSSALLDSFNHFSRELRFSLRHVDPAIFWGMILIAIVSIIKMITR